ncbi:MAG: LD-carboxypeptidase [Muribaculaceae bacterium]
MIYPSSLQKGDKIAIISPASHIRHEYVDAACRIIAEWGYEPVVSEHCKGTCGTYSGTIEERLADLVAAFTDTSVRAIMCSRGGYGVVHLLDLIDPEIIRRNPKWVIGFSDISAMHAAMHRCGIASIHSPMTKQFAVQGAADECIVALRGILEGRMPAYIEPPHPFNRPGTVTGELIGGNLAVLCGLQGSQWDIFAPGKILFIEDVAEAVYRVERMLYNLRLRGILGQLGGLIVGRFTEFTSPDGNGDTMETMVRRMVEPYGYPVAFDFPVGHIDRNLPLVEGSTATLSVTSTGTTLSMA